MRCQTRPKFKPKPNLDQLPDAAFVRANALLESGILPFSRATLWRLAKEGKFPAPVKVTDNITAWRVGDVRRWQVKLGGETVDEVL